MSEERITLRCEKCGKWISFAASSQGKVEVCPECDEYIDVPTQDGELEAFFFEEEDFRRKQAQRYIEQLNAGDRNLLKIEQALDRLEKLLARWEAIADRADRVLERFEGGQA